MRYLTFAFSIIPLVITAPLSLVTDQSFDSSHNVGHTITSRMHNEQYSSSLIEKRGTIFLGPLYEVQAAMDDAWATLESSQSGPDPRPGGDPVQFGYHQLLGSLGAGLTTHEIPYNPRVYGQSTNDYVHYLLGRWIANYQKSFGDPPVPLDLTQEAKTIISQGEDLKYAMRNDPWRWMKTLRDIDPSLVNELNEAKGDAYDDKTRAFQAFEADVKAVAKDIGIRVMASRGRVQAVSGILQTIETDKKLYDSAVGTQHFERLNSDVAALERALRQQN
ncbi:hypothetical protein FRB99_007922 [Tulasnella sp. 403]|nr:hypothetical protein FRB99_007922 [Tulasnella sp. 403]